MDIERWKCQVCGKIGPGRIPTGGDGSEILPHRHKYQDRPCPGYSVSAILVKDQVADQPEPAGEEDYIAEWNRRFGWLRSSDDEPEPAA